MIANNYSYFWQHHNVATFVLIVVNKRDIIRRRHQMRIYGLFGVLRQHKTKVGKNHFYEAIYLRHHFDLRFKLEAEGFTSGYDHFERNGRFESRRRTYRRLGPGQGVSFPMRLPQRALSGLQIMLGVEGANQGDRFVLTLIDRGRAVWRQQLPFGCVVIDNSTDVLTGPITGLSDEITVRLDVEASARNDLWLMTTTGDATTKTPFSAEPFFDNRTISLLAPSA